VRLTRHARVLAVLALAASAFTVNATNASAGETFEFSVLPGTAAWAALKTHQEMEAATQIPQPVAAAMPTDKLLDVALRYPLTLDAVAFNSVQEGFEVVVSRFNGLSELLARPDAAAVLLQRYRAAQVAVTGDPDGLQAGDQTVYLWKLEMMLAQPQVIVKMSPALLESAMREGEAKFAAKQANAVTYGQSGLEPTATLLGRALATREGWSWKNSGLLSDGIALVPGAPEGILAAVRRHFAEPAKAHAIASDLQAAQDAGLAVSPQDFTGTVYTPRGTAVTVTVTTFELTTAEINSYNSYVAANYPSATRETNASRMYNCHSYAWYSTSTSNNVWMNTPGDDKYWQDGSYTLWRPPYIWFSDMKLSWQQGDHTGRMQGTSNYVRSKWGQLPQMYHYYTYSPYNMGSGPPPYVIGQGLNWFFLT